MDKCLKWVRLLRDAIQRKTFYYLSMPVKETNQDFLSDLVKWSRWNHYKF